MPRVESADIRKSISVVKVPVLTRALLSDTRDTTKYTIQKVLQEAIFKAPIVNNEVISGFSVEDFNKRLSNLRSRHAVGLNRLFTTKPGDLGPGELLLYFLIDDYFISKNGDIDAKIGNTEYEVKAVLASNVETVQGGKATKYYGFSTGGASKIKLTEVQGDLQRLKQQIETKTTSKNDVVEVSDIKAFRQDPKLRDQFESLQATYSKEIYNRYFKGKNFIFLDNRVNRKGNMLYVGEIKPEMIGIYRFSKNQIQPSITI